MKTDGRGWLSCPPASWTVRLPAHYEPAESPVKNPLYKQQSSPVYKYWKRDDNALSSPATPASRSSSRPYRLTGAYLARRDEPCGTVAHRAAAGALHSLSPELAAEKGIANLDWVRGSPRRAATCAPRRS